MVSGTLAMETPPKDSGSDPRIDTARVMEIARRKFSAYDAANPAQTLYPSHARGKDWKQVHPRDWVSGFYPGCLWYLYEDARKRALPEAEKLREIASRWTEGLRDQQFNTGHHDTGFMIFDSYGNGLRLTTNPSYPGIIRQAAQSLASRYVPECGLIRSWGKMTDTNSQTVIIDNMMNLELLLWSSEHGGKTAGGGDLRKIAVSHADRVMDLFFRDDGSIYHVVDVNPRNGEVIRKRTRQGKGDGTCWSRGQAWTLYGFGTMYRHTRDPKYLKAAEKAADYYLEHLPPDSVPPSDFQSTLTGLPFKDSSAAAVAASGLLQLSELEKDPVVARKYFKAAEKTLVSLTSPPYLAGDDKPGLLDHGAYIYTEDPSNERTDECLIFGDYYLLEALLGYERLKPSQGH
jgi:hypothetical protein